MIGTGIYQNAIINQQALFNRQNAQSIMQQGLGLISSYPRCERPAREKTIREELQCDIDEWLKDSI